MGNAIGYANPPKMGLIALSQTIPLTKDQLHDLMHECIIVTCGCQFSSYTIDRDSFRLALMDTMVDDKAVDVLDSLFTLWDAPGNNYIQYREFLVGVCPLACGSRDTLSSILLFGLALMDTPNTGRTTQHDLTKVLAAINTTASYIGDSVLKSTEIDDIVYSVFGTSLTKTMSHTDVVPRIVMHPKVGKFIHGCGTARYKPPQVDKSREAKKRKRERSKSGEFAKRLYEC